MPQTVILGGSYHRSATTSSMIGSRIWCFLWPESLISVNSDDA